MTLKQMPKVGDKVRFIGQRNTGYHDGVTIGKEYEIYEIGDYGYANFIDDRNSEYGNSYISEEYFKCFELVTEEPSPSVVDILANLALRVSELERHNREQAYEINKLYKAVSK